LKKRNCGCIVVAIVCEKQDSKIFLGGHKHHLICAKKKLIFIFQVVKIQLELQMTNTNIPNTNIQLFIKRAEKYQDENFIKSRLRDLGEIESLKFIDKKDDHGNNYKHVIVTFVSWNYVSETVSELLTSLLMPNCQTKFHFKDNHGKERFWHIQKHTPARTDTPPPENPAGKPLNEREIQEIKLENTLLREQLRAMEQQMMAMEAEKIKQLTNHWAIRDDNMEKDILIDQLNKELVELKQENTY